MYFHRLTSLISILLAIACATAQAAERPSAAGFYGGVTLRQPGGPTSGMTLGIPASALNRMSIPVVDDAASHATLFGGYRWGNDIAVEAALNTSDPYALRPGEARGAQRGLGVVPSASSLGLTDVQAKTWNVDLYTGWNFYRNFALYGRLGYAQTDVTPTFGSTLLAASDGRRLRDGVNYGVGVRYDMTSSLGLRLEYGRFGRFAGEAGSSPLESDQVTVGLQFRF